MALISMRHLLIIFCLLAAQMCQAQHEDNTQLYNYSLVNSNDSSDVVPISYNKLFVRFTPNSQDSSDLPYYDKFFLIEHMGNFLVEDSVVKVDSYNQNTLGNHGSSRYWPVVREEKVTESGVIYADYEMSNIHSLRFLSRHKNSGWIGVTLAGISMAIITPLISVSFEDNAFNQNRFWTMQTINLGLIVGSIIWFKSFKEKVYYMNPYDWEEVDAQYDLIYDPDGR